MQKTRLILLIVLLLHISKFTWGQREAENWIYGWNNWISFSSGQPVFQAPVPNAIQNASVSISNKNGQLLFYGGNSFVYDRLHQLMPGVGLGLMPYLDNNAMQTLLCIPFPNNDSIYYLFYLENITTQKAPRLVYALVNIKARGGLGDVIQKDIPLLNGDTVCLKMTATLHCNKRDFWLIGHVKNSDKYFSLLINPNGINPPVYSSGTFINETTSTFAWAYNHKGYMKVSPLGDKLAAGYQGDFDMIEYLDFNNQTGMVSNPRVLYMKPGWAEPVASFAGAGPYGLEFSPSGRYLYTTGIYDFNWGGGEGLKPTNVVYQFDLISNNAASIQSTRFFLDSSLLNFGKGMQLGVDGKVYLIRTRHLSVINNPELQGGACNFNRTQLLSPDLNASDLPSFIQSYLRYPVITTGNCQFQNISFAVQNLAGVNAIAWDFGDPASGINNTSTSFTPTHIFSQQGAYEVKAILYNASGCGADTIRKLIHAGPFQVYLGNDTTLCQEDTLTLRLSMSIPNVNLVWNNNSIDTFIRVTQPGTYWVRANVGECVASDTINVTVRPLPTFTLGNDTLICSNQPITLSPNPAASNVTYLWNTGATNQTINTNQAGAYWLKITENGYGCIYRDTINIQFKPLPNYSLGSDTSLCEGNSLLLNADVTGGTNYLWNTGATTPAIHVSQTNIYWADVTKDQCVYRDSINVLFKPLPMVNLGNDTTICEGQTYLLNAGNSGSQYQWQDNSTFQTFIVNGAGKYWVDVITDGCLSRDTININYDLKPVFTIGKDTTICDGMTIQLQAKIRNPQGVSYLWSNGLTSPSVAITQKGIYSLVATNYCGSNNDDIMISKGVCKIYVPSAFTPNNDGLNDYFRASFGENVTDFRLQVYNRWGGIVFESNDIRKGWDGKTKGVAQSNGVYVWVIKYKTLSEPKEALMRGTVILIR